MFLMAAVQRLCVFVCSWLCSSGVLSEESAGRGAAGQALLQPMASGSAAGTTNSKLPDLVSGRFVDSFEARIRVADTKQSKVAGRVS